MNDFTIVVNSCDKYSDAWEPFFRLLKINWPECEKYRIILNTETKVFDCDFLNIETICGGHTTWSKRIKNVLKKIDSELVVFLLEDFFLKSAVSDEDFLKIVNAMIQDKLIGYVALKYQPDRKLKDGAEPQGLFICRDNLFVKYRTPLISSIWNRKFFIRLLREHESPWEFEEYAGIRSKKYKYKIMDINNNIGGCGTVFDYNIDMQYGVGIAKGKWLMPKTKEFLDSYGINVDYDNLGTDYETYYSAINQINSAQPDTYTDETFVKAKGLREALYKTKKSLIKFPIRLKKFIRKAKSLV